MFISDVDLGLERLLRERVPLPEDIGDVSFEPPNETWSASLSRLTINMFLYHVEQSTQPSRSAVTRTEEDGTQLRRRLLPMIDLNYMVSAWAGSPLDEHQLLGDAISVFAGVGFLPEDITPETLNTSVSITLGDEIKPREIWQGVGGKLKASFVVRATVGADTWDWETQAPPVERVSVLSDPNSTGDAVPFATGGWLPRRR